MAENSTSQLYQIKYSITHKHTSSFIENKKPKPSQTLKHINNVMRSIQQNTNDRARVLYTSNNTHTKKKTSSKLKCHRHIHYKLPW